MAETIETECRDEKWVMGGWILFAIIVGFCSTPLWATDKLIDSDQVLQAFELGQETVDVIVCLRPPLTVTSEMDSLRIEVEQSQQAVLSSVSSDAFLVRHRYQNVSAFSGAVTQDGLKQLIANPNVLSVEPVRILYAHVSQGIALMNALAARTNYNGANMSIAICDTGIDYTHPQLGNGGFPNTKVIGGYDFGDNDADPMDCQGHGTAVAGIAAGEVAMIGDYIGGVAYNAKLYALKIASGCTDSATSSDIIAAWDWCVTHQNDDSSNPIMVISTSFGGGLYTSTCDGSSSATTSAANAATVRSASPWCRHRAMTVIATGWVGLRALRA